MIEKDSATAILLWGSVVPLNEEKWSHLSHCWFALEHSTVAGICSRHWVANYRLSNWINRPANYNYVCMRDVGQVTDNVRENTDQHSVTGIGEQWTTVLMTTVDDDDSLWKTIIINGQRMMSSVNTERNGSYWIQAMERDEENADRLKRTNACS